MLVEAINGMMLAACFLRYADALKLGDNYASATSRAARSAAALYISPADEDRMWRRWGVENPSGLDPSAVERDRRMLDGRSL